MGRAYAHFLCDTRVRCQHRVHPESLLPIAMLRTICQRVATLFHQAFTKHNSATGMDSDWERKNCSGSAAVKVQGSTRQAAPYKRNNASGQPNCPSLPAAPGNRSENAAASRLRPQLGRNEPAIALNSLASWPRCIVFNSPAYRWSKVFSSRSLPGCACAIPTARA